MTNNTPADVPHLSHTSTHSPDGHHGQASQACPLCQHELGLPLLWQDDWLRVVLVDDANSRAQGLAGYTRVIWRAHVAEMCELDAPARARLHAVLHVVETTQRRVLRPHKLNLASLGNQVPHLHWHLVPRWAEDAFFPQSIWSAPCRVPPADWLQPQAALLAAYRHELPKALQHWAQGRL